jgi:hypothetical protein
MTECEYTDWWSGTDGEKPKCSEKNLSQCVGWNLGLCSNRLANNHLNHSMASQILVKGLYLTKTGGYVGNTTGAHPPMPMNSNPYHI